MTLKLIRTLFHVMTIINVAAFAANYVSPYAAARILMVTFLVWAVIEIGWCGGDPNYKLGSKRRG